MSESSYSTERSIQESNDLCTYLWSGVNPIRWKDQFWESRLSTKCTLIVLLINTALSIYLNPNIRNFIYFMIPTLLFFLYFESCLHDRHMIYSWLLPIGLTVCLVYNAIQTYRKINNNAVKIRSILKIPESKPVPKRKKKVRFSV